MPSDSEKTKTARFAEVVEAAGKPEPYMLWMDPKKDRSFQSALKQHRILSVHHQTVGTKADYGHVGYEGDPKAQLLLFPKSLARFAGRKIIGVKYDLLAPLKEAPARAKPSKPAKKKTEVRLVRHHEPEPKPEPEPEPEPPPKEPEPVQAVELTREELVEGIRRAMKLLDDGKAVAAYRTLEGLVEAAP